MYQPQQPEDVVKPGPNVNWLQVVGVVGTVKLQGLIEGEDARVGRLLHPVCAADPPRHRRSPSGRANDPASITSTLQRALAEVDPELQLLRRLHDGRTRREVAEPAADADAAVARVRRSSRCCWRDRHLRRAGVSGQPADARVRDPDGARQRRGGILRLVLREGARWSVWASAQDGIGAVLLRRLIVSQLYGVGAFDPASSRGDRRARARLARRLSWPGAACHARGSGYRAGPAVAGWPGAPRVVKGRATG